LSEDGMHTQNSGERSSRSPNHKSTISKEFGSGLRSVRDRARLSNAVGYNSKQAPRIPRIADKK